MNRIYRVIWNHGLNTWVVASEKTKACSKRSGTSVTRTRATVSTAQTSPGKSNTVRLGEYLLPLGMLLAAVNVAAQTPPAANALPTGGTVSAGSASVSSVGNRMQITQSSNRAALNWNTFDIGANAGVNFTQPSAQSVALNRVASNNPTQIFGSLTANGKLILINPNGVVFGQGAQVNAAGLIATTNALSDANFMSGNYHFTQGGSGSVSNAGNLVVSPGGTVLLMADNVFNTGHITAPAGTVGLLTGTSMQVAPDWQAVTATPGSSADASQVVLNNSGTIDVSGAQGGTIMLDGGASGITQSSGQLLASGSSGAGGQVTMLGYNVGMLSGSVIDASGQTGGGTVLVGGNWHGAGPERNANAVYMDPNATINVDATAQGAGGSAVLWSNQYTDFNGTISARGGVQGGNGGQVETSSQAQLVANGMTDASARASTGTAGNWLLDPSDVTIVASGGSGALNGSGTYNPTTAEQGQLPTPSSTMP